MNNRKNRRDIFLLSIELNRKSPTPLYDQICEHIRKAIMENKLNPETRLPSTRDLADLLAVSRNTVKNAFEQLSAEGFLESMVGSGTYVSKDLPADFLEARLQKINQVTPARSGRSLSTRSKDFSTQIDFPANVEQNAFRIGMPAIDLFPFDLWARLSAKYYRYSSLELFDSVIDATGYPPLKEALANYLLTARGVRCEPGQIMVVNGSQQAIYLTVQLLLDAGDQAWVEEPGYLGIKGALRSARAKPVPIPVDEEGIQVREGIRRSPKARLAFVTPSHQFPLGVTMTISRRFELLEWAEKNKAWILEDDYDSEYRYKGRPIPSLQGLDVSNRVIYIGTFSKVLFPGLRIGYIIVPPDLLETFHSAYKLIYSRVSPVTQAALADFINQGYFSRHIRRMRKIYAHRRQVFLKAAAEILGDRLKLIFTESGMHLVGWLEPGLDDEAVTRSAARLGIVTLPISRFYIGAPPGGGLVLGYTGVRPDTMQPHLSTLSKAIQEC